MLHFEILNVKVEVGPSSRWNELVMTQILDNLLSKQLIDLEFYVDAMPSSSGFPKAKMVHAYYYNAESLYNKILKMHFFTWPSPSIGA